jgi:hypothetical protein
MRAALLLAAGLALLIAAAARDEAFGAEDRYTVLGFVRDARGQPRVGQTVELVRDKTGLAYRAETDGEGLYVVVARLGHETLGEGLTLRIGEARTRLTVQFEVDSDRGDRGTRVDLEGTRWVERSAWFRSTLTRIVTPPTH